MKLHIATSVPPVAKRHSRGKSPGKGEGVRETGSSGHNRESVRPDRVVIENCDDT